MIFFITITVACTLKLRIAAFIVTIKSMIDYSMILSLILRTLHETRSVLKIFLKLIK